MNWLSIFNTVVANMPNVGQLVLDLTKALQTHTTPVPTPTPVPGAPAPTTPGIPGQGKPSDTVKTIQRLLNQYVAPTPPLVEDGWLGPRTEAVIQQALVLAGPYLTMFGVKI